jgi:hypothetical protein
MYYHLHDEDSQQTMMALPESASGRSGDGENHPAFEGNLRATGQSRIEKTLHVPEVRALAATLSDITERPGFEPGVEVYPLQRFSKPSP